MSGNFFDSNVILYLTSSDDTIAIRAEDVLRSGGTISVQVLNECANVLRKKNKLDWPDIRIFLKQVRQRLEVVPVSVETHQTGLRLAERYGSRSTTASSLLPHCRPIATRCGRRTCRTAN